MSERESEKVLLDNVRSQLDAGVERLAPSIQVRLQESRRQAVALAGEPRHFPFVPRWVTAGGLATLAVVAVASSFWFSEPRHPQKVKDVEEIEVMTTQGNLEMYEELEFYRWLAENRNGR